MYVHFIVGKIKICNFISDMKCVCFEMNAKRKKSLFLKNAEVWQQFTLGDLVVVMPDVCEKCKFMG